ncbi:MAG: hypothetical protein JWM68_3438 [Verrucomicrobiales bacterium]|nr:hypothetical protein [Verrucomicrobiales bacterium]
MEQLTDSFGKIGASSRHFARRLLTIGENRLELLMVEVQEERERILHAILLALGVAVFTFLAGAALTVGIVVLLWHLSPVAVLLVLASLYAITAGVLYRRFAILQQDWKTLPATLDQLRKDRACLEKSLE